MSEQRSINGLIDFSELRKKNQDYNTYVSKSSAGSNGVQLNLDNNEQIIKSFKQLRDKLKIANRENSQIREEMGSLQVHVKQLLQSQKNLLNVNHQLKQKNSQIQQLNDELKKRINILKEQVVERQHIKNQLQFVKQSLVETKDKNGMLEEEKKKLMEISIEDKINFEQKINRIELKKQSDDHYLSQVQSQLSKAKQTLLKQQNAFKKLEIKYDQEVFNKQWSKENFQKQYYDKKIAELEAALNECKSKNKRQKQKRLQLQNRLLQVQQMSGLCNVKAQAYEGEVELMTKRMKKMERRVSQAKQSANKLANLKTNWEQKFIKSCLICEELTNRVKRQVLGDMVQLAKTCQYRLNKLKENKQADKIDLSKTQRLSKKHKTDRKRKSIAEKQNVTQPKDEQSYKRTQLDSYSGTVLFQHNLNKPVQAQQIKENIQFNSIDMKIRRQRDQMQRRLKEKILYRQIDVSNSPRKSKLRQEYLKQILQR